MPNTKFNHTTLTFQISVLDTPPMPAAEFKAHCLEAMDRVKDKEVIVTKQGKPLAKLVPVHARGPELSGFFAVSLTYHAQS